MGEIHDALERVTGSLIHKDAKLSPQDREKITAEMAGERRPTAGSAYAQGLIRLARLGPPRGSGPPPPAAAQARPPGAAAGAR